MIAQIVVAAAVLTLGVTGPASGQTHATVVRGANGMSHAHPYPDTPPLPALRTNADATAAQAAEQQAIDALIGQVYVAISGLAGPRDWDAFKALFVPEARLVPVGGKGPLVLDVQGYIDRAGPMMAREGFYESEVSRRVERYGNIAHVWSTYESRHAPGGQPFARGINSIQIVKTPAGWRVLHIVWQGETPTLPIPGAYLPKTDKR
ncbi:MAG TPA: nuclear transport factor 2 family protein [Sphingomonas sp.]|nr:nuclear transport factor 2 family protein [Sphingomonas sp.]